MKIVTLGDTHGRDIWKTIVKIEEDFDKFIFIGDYFDTRDDINA
jgi:predicted phosphodiesterase